MTLVAEPVLVHSRPERIVLRNVSWSYYERTLEELHETHIRVTFDRGSLEMMSPNSAYHEGTKGLVRRLIEMYTFEREIPLLNLGSVTCRREDLQCGVEPDECFYVHNMPSDPYTMNLDLNADPPPDLAIEVDITSGSIPREPIYGALGVPEIWRLTGRAVQCRHRQANGTYVDAGASLAFPSLSMPEFNRFLALMIERPREQHANLKAFQRWARVQA